MPPEEVPSVAAAAEEDSTHTSIATVSFSPEPEMEIYGEVGPVLVMDGHLNFDSQTVRG